MQGAKVDVESGDSFGVIFFDATYGPAVGEGGLAVTAWNFRMTSQMTAYEVVLPVGHDLPFHGCFWEFLGAGAEAVDANDGSQGVSRILAE